MAVIVSVPVASAVVVKDACPLELSVTGEPVLTPLTLNCTVPSGSPVPAVGATVAVIVTEALKVEGFAELDSVVVVAAATAVPDMLITCSEPVTARELLVRIMEPETEPVIVGSKSTA